MNAGKVYGGRYVKLTRDVTTIECFCLQLITRRERRNVANATRQTFGFHFDLTIDVSLPTYLNASVVLVSLCMCVSLCLQTFYTRNTFGYVGVCVSVFCLVFLLKNCFVFRQ